ARVFDGALGRFDAEIAGRPLAVVRHVATLLDPGASADPLVVGLGLLRVLADVLVVQERDLFVLDDAVGDVGPEAQDLRANHPAGVARNGSAAKTERE